MPRRWRDDLAEIAGMRAMSMADLHRQLVRDFLRHRHDEPAA